MKDIVIRGTSKLAQSTTRRHFLKGVARTTLGIVGITTVGYALGDFAPKAAYATHECSLWFWCGLKGKPCSSCGGQAHICPGGTTQGPRAVSWTCCCCDSGGSCWTVRYLDCCVPEGTGTCTSHAPCNNNNKVGNNFWCPADMEVYCTIFNLEGNC